MIELSAENFKYFLIQRRTVRIIIFLSLLLWCFGFPFASLFPKSEAIIFYPFLKQIYSTVCHQIDYKSLGINGINFLVCARCSGIYLGSLLSSVLFLFLTEKISSKIDYLFISAAPMLIDVIFYSTGIYPYSKIIAFITGLIFGFAVIGFILISIEDHLLKGHIKV